MGTKFDAAFVTCFFRWGLIAHKFRLLLLVVPFLLTAFLSVGLYWIKEQVSVNKTDSLSMCSGNTDLRID